MSIELFMTETYLTKRPAKTAAVGKRGSLATFLTNVKGTPLDPVSDQDTRIFRIELGAPTNLLKTYVDNEHDIRPGDYLRCDGVDYPVKGVAPWKEQDALTAYKIVVVEQLVK